MAGALCALPICVRIVRARAVIRVGGYYTLQPDKCQRGKVLVRTTGGGSQLSGFHVQPSQGQRPISL